MGDVKPLFFGLVLLATIAVYAIAPMVLPKQRWYWAILEALGLYLFVCLTVFAATRRD